MRCAVRKPPCDPPVTTVLSGSVNCKVSTTCTTARYNTR